MTPISQTLPITPAQVRAIHVAIRAAGIADEDYRARLRAGWGVGTCKDLTRRQASDLLVELGRPRPQPARPRARAARPRPQPLPPGVVRMVTPAQRRLIEQLAAEVDWREPDGYRRWLARNQGLAHAATAAAAARVIEGLKALRRKRA